jgi:hypothetical protein
LSKLEEPVFDRLSKLKLELKHYQFELSFSLPMAPKATTGRTKLAVAQQKQRPRKIPPKRRYNMPLV